jgi:hypothetical protein
MLAYILENYQCTCRHPRGGHQHKVGRGRIRPGCGKFWREKFSDQNLHELLPRDIRLATSNGLSGNAVPNWRRAYHGNAAKHREQSDVEGTHVICDNTVCPTVRKIFTRCEGGISDRKTANVEGVKTRSFVGR